MKKLRINNQITAPELRVISDDGDNFGVLKLEEALKIAKERGTDLLEISPTAIPPVAKIMDYGKFQYQEKKKIQQAKKTHETEIKGIRINIGTGQHDLEMKSKKISEFLKDGHRVKVDLILKGRAKYLQQDFFKERMDRLLNLITEEFKIASGPQKGPRGISVVIEKIAKK